MAEGQKYDPIIEENMETKGVNTGRFKNTELNRQVVENVNRFYGDRDVDQLIDEDIKGALNEAGVREGDLPGMIKANAQDFEGRVSELDQREQERLEANRDIVRETANKEIDRALDIRSQYDELQDQAKAIRDDMTPSKETPEDEPQQQ